MPGRGVPRGGPGGLRGRFRRGDGGAAGIRCRGGGDRAGTRRSWRPETDDPEGLARAIQQRVRAATQLDCTVGIGQNKLQAKLATGFGKPAGIFRLTYENWFEVLGGRPTDALWGIGAKTAKRLAELGIGTVAELAAADPGRAGRQFGPATGPWLVLLARGHGERAVDDTPYRPRSHGREVTFQQNIADWPRVVEEVTRLAGGGRR